MSSVISLLHDVVNYLQDIRKDKKDKESKKEQEKKEDEIDDVCNKGKLDDLFDFIRGRIGKVSTKAACAILLVVACGCKTEEQDINVQTTKCWENHYMSTRDFYNGTSNIKLDKDESIWVLSNRSMSRILKQTGK